jgi:hypothetical protein
MKFDRRDFLQAMSVGCTGLAITTGGFAGGANIAAGEAVGSDFDALTRGLLTDWCNGMIAAQIDEPDDPTRHGAFACPSCDWLHGRCIDAVYPLMRMARVTGEDKYQQAAINVMQWSKNVTEADGRWRNGVEPDSWPGTTIFAAIAVAEALHYHGDLLDTSTRSQWTRRLDQAAEGYLFNELDRIDFANINYGLTAIYGYHLIGELLDKQKFIDRSQEFAGQAKRYFTEPNKLLFGEGKPRDETSDRGLYPVDLGYNVEESLNGAVMYAVEQNDTELLKLLTESMNSHLEFMLPDGAWDNSWGTRQAKWSYWGSRTSDGCQPAFSLMADRNPAFGAAAYRNAELLKRCTVDGLLHGGIHYVSHGVKPCIHHTFAHAKVMALIQDKIEMLPKIDHSVSIPQDRADGVKEFSDLAVWLASRGPWRGTISAYDRTYNSEGKSKYIQQATGGSLAVLYHTSVGPLLTSSMAEYIMVEEANMQPQPVRDFPLTLRVETRKDGSWYTNLYDLKAKVQSRDDGERIQVDVKTSLRDRERDTIKGDVSRFDIGYSFDQKQITITVKSSDGSVSEAGASLVLPIVSASGEKVTQVSGNRIEITKPGGTVVIESSVPMTIEKTKRDRIFNMVPGMEAIPISVALPRTNGMQATCTISVI